MERSDLLGFIYAALALGLVIALAVSLLCNPHTWRSQLRAHLKTLAGKCNGVLIIDISASPPRRIFDTVLSTISALMRTYGAGSTFTIICHADRVLSIGEYPGWAIPRGMQDTHCIGGGTALLPAWRAALQCAPGYILWLTDGQACDIQAFQYAVDNTKGAPCVLWLVPGHTRMPRGVTLNIPLK